MAEPARERPIRPQRARLRPLRHPRRQSGADGRRRRDSAGTRAHRASLRPNPHRVGGIGRTATLHSLSKPAGTDAMRRGRLAFSWPIDDPTHVPPTLRATHRAREPAARRALFRMHRVGASAARVAAQRAGNPFDVTDSFPHRAAWAAGIPNPPALGFRHSVLCFVP
ncbi:hypothetical protein [Burkholderia dolosa]|uniref:hypothetical protein n=1 Tax=Burkholderia dolosa TaxID=152500 RepID=UPI0027D2D7DA|nr:hypothetical protein [Burkholderia dolosa]